MCMVAITITKDYGWNSGTTTGGKYDWGLFEATCKTAASGGYCMGVGPTSGTKSTIKYSDLGGKIDDVAGETVALLFTTVVLLLIAVIFAITLCVISKPALALGGFFVSFVAMVLQLAAWARWADQVGDDAFAYDWAFIWAIICFPLLLLFAIMWIFAYTVIKAGTVTEEHSERVPTTPGGGTYASGAPVYTANSVHEATMKLEAHVESNMHGPKADHAEIVKETGVPEGCKDFKVARGKLVESEHEEDWRTAGHTKVEYGFELTQDVDNQEGHLLCRVPFTTEGSEIFASLEYVMEPKSAADGGGQGLCVYLCDPEVDGWDRHFDGTGPLGFVGKKGALIGVGIDCTGTFCEGQPASVAIKRASDCKLLCDPVPLEGGVVTHQDEYWRKVKVKFDIVDNKCDVTIGDTKVLDDVKFEGVTIPKTVCIGVCAGTSDGKTNHICVNKLKLTAQDDN